MVYTVDLIQYVRNFTYSSLIAFISLIKGRESATKNVGNPQAIGCLKFPSGLMVHLELTSRSLPENRCENQAVHVLHPDWKYHISEEVVHQYVILYHLGCPSLKQHQNTSLQDYGKSPFFRFMVCRLYLSQFSYWGLTSKGNHAIPHHKMVSPSPSTKYKKTPAQNSTYPTLNSIFH